MYVLVVHWPLDSSCTKSHWTAVVFVISPLCFCYFAFRMPMVEATAGTLKVCLQAQDQLQNAINTVVKAEQELRENTREVRNDTLILAHLSQSPSFFSNMRICLQSTQLALSSYWKKLINVLCVCSLENNWNLVNDPQWHIYFVFACWMTHNRCLVHIV